MVATAIKDASSEPVFTTLYGGADLYCGKTMANGLPFDCSALTAAHPSLPFGTVLRVTYLGRSVDVTVTDRCACGLDLSMAAADVIGLPGADVADVVSI